MGKPLIKIKGVGKKTYNHLKDAGIWNTYDLVSYVPKKYLNFAVSSFDELKHLEIVTVTGKINGPIQKIKRKVVLTTTFIEVDGKTIKLLIFGRDYIDKVFNEGDQVLVNGKFNLFLREIHVSYMTHQKEVPQIKPVYQIEGIYDTLVSQIIQTVFDEGADAIYETLPLPLITQYDMLKRKDAIYTLHFPKEKADLEKARLRFKREEAFFHLLSYLFSLSPKLSRKPILYQLDWVKQQIEKLPFQLTLDQQEVVNDIYRDFKKNTSLYRLIQGDVGSGKTIVGFMAALGMISAGYQVAMMMPTEILARQHFENFQKLFPNVSAALLTSSLKNKDEVIESIQEGRYQLVFGTHILALKQVVFSNLGLIIIDEQHKFGVELRDMLISKSKTQDCIYLTATPIPRSLSLTFFGHLDVSSIKMRPHFQKPVATKLLKNASIESIVHILKEAQARLEQSFIIAPAILESKDKASIESIYSKVSLFFKDEDLYVIHGQLKPAENELIMTRFMANPRGILLSTTMIEVGIDVKNATTMIIMGAHHFGLSQLHQLRGRVGRGEKKGMCYLVSQKSDSERLSFFEQTNDGFLLSAYDLKLRGPGAFSSFIQSGKISFQYLDLNSDLNILIEMKKDAESYLKQLDKYPHLRKRISNLMI